MYILFLDIHAGSTPKKEGNISVGDSGYRREFLRQTETTEFIDSIQQEKVTYFWYRML